MLEIGALASEVGMGGAVVAILDSIAIDCRCAYSSTGGRIAVPGLVPVRERNFSNTLDLMVSGLRSAGVGLDATGAAVGGTTGGGASTAGAASASAFGNSRLPNSSWKSLSLTGCWKPK